MPALITTEHKLTIRFRSKDLKRNVALEHQILDEINAKAEQWDLDDWLTDGGWGPDSGVTVTHSDLDELRRFANWVLALIECNPTYEVI